MRLQNFKGRSRPHEKEPGWWYDSTSDIDTYVREKTTLYDGTVIYRFSKEILAYIETLVAFSPWNKQNDPHTAGALGAFYTAALQDYAA
eukprot:CAMPEP_0172174524 /NCGR_PEP_ID=MMETSP1050-20130122/13718_1 /TAXON_ID=233186 /ORGANISM="Cryptomonas curvata, Strain CCAP979/52" /LENGTH=88 /DNA_ID=CAMNT_0012846521 /DNA_START=349 /DNA_END=615 /DNA_ORIENTATION=-